MWQFCSTACLVFYQIALQMAIFLKGHLVLFLKFNELGQIGRKFKWSVPIINFHNRESRFKCPYQYFHYAYRAVIVHWCKNYFNIMVFIIEHEFFRPNFLCTSNVSWDPVIEHVCLHKTNYFVCFIICYYCGRQKSRESIDAYQYVDIFIVFVWQRPCEIQLDFFYGIYYCV